MKYLKRIIGIIKCEWEIFCYVESVEGYCYREFYGKEALNKKIEMIYKKYGIERRK